MDEHVRIEPDWAFPEIDADLKLIVGFLAVALASTYLPIISETAIRSILALALAVIVPGYALVAALFPGRKDLDGIDRAGLSLGMSVAVTPLAGLLLNFTPWGVHLNPLIVCLTLFSLSCLTIAHVRRHRLLPEDRFSPDLAAPGRTALAAVFQRDRSRLDRALTAFLVLSILASAAMLGFMAISPKTGESYTQFYILGPDGEADHYPGTLLVGVPSPVTVGVVNNEHRPMTYDLIVALNDSSGASRIYTDQFTLADNQTLEKQLDLVPDRAGKDMRLNFELYAYGNADTPYREVYLWVNVT